MRPAKLTTLLCAMLYDTLCLLGIFIIITWGAIMLNHGHALPPGQPGLQMALLASYAAFFLFFWCCGGQTLGMLAWRIRLVRVDGGMLSPTQACLRLLASWLSFACLGLGYWSVLWREDGASWHDRLSRSRVVQLDKKTKAHSRTVP